MATLFGSSPFLSHPITRIKLISSSSSSSPSSQQISALSPLPSPQMSSSCSSKQLPTKSIRSSINVETNDWPASTLTRRLGLRWAASFLAVGVISQQVIKTLLLHVSQDEANTRNVEKLEEVVLPNGIRYYDVKVGGGAIPNAGDMVMMNLKGEVEGSGDIFVDTFGDLNKTLAQVIMGSRPYEKGMCEGIECVLGSMKAGGIRRVTVPPNLGFGEIGANLGFGLQIPPFATLHYIIEVEHVSIAPS